MSSGLPSRQGPRISTALDSGPFKTHVDAIVGYYYTFDSYCDLSSVGLGGTSLDRPIAPNDAGESATPSITFYGTQWCGDCHRSRRLLDRLSVPYAYVDVNADPDAAVIVRAINGGYQSVPTITLGSGGPVLVEPSDRELQAALSDAGFLAVARNGA